MIYMIKRVLMEYDVVEIVGVGSLHGLGNWDLFCLRTGEGQDQGVSGYIFCLSNSWKIQDIRGDMRDIFMKSG